MTLSDRYRRLATLIDALEAQGLTVRSAAPADESAAGTSGDGEMSVTLEVELPSGPVLDQLVETSSASVTVDDAEQPSADRPSETTFRTDSPADAARNGAASGDPADSDTSDESQTTDGAADAVGAGTESSNADTESNSATTTDDDTPATTDDDTSEPADGDAADVVDCTHPDCDRTFETERGMKIHRTKAHSLSELLENGTDEAVHCDPEVLARVYEEYDTFAEMTEALDVDVGPQAVRKQMIRHDIHQPGEFTRSSATRETDSADAVDESNTDRAERLVTDGDDSRHSGSDGRPRGEDEQAADAADEQADDAAEQESAASDGPTRGDEQAVDGSAENGASARNGASSSESLNGSARNGESDSSDGSARNGESDSSDGSARNGESDTSDESDPVDDLPHLDLPNSISVADLQTAVEEATTLYDVQRAIGLDRDETRDLLRQYDLLELVSGRAATVREREELKTEIHERIQRAAT